MSEKDRKGYLIVVGCYVKVEGAVNPYFGWVEAIEGEDVHITDKQSRERHAKLNWCVVSKAAPLTKARRTGQKASLKDHSDTAKKRRGLRRKK